MFNFFNFSCVLNVSHLLRSSSGRQLYVYVQLRCVLQLTPIYVKHTVNANTPVSLKMNPRGSKRVGDNKNEKKLNTNI